MADLRSRPGTGQRGGPCIAKEVQDPHLAALPHSGSNLLHGKIPVDRLLREHARMLEPHALEPESQITVPNFPHRGEFPVNLPFPSPCLGTKYRA